MRVPRVTVAGVRYTPDVNMLKGILYDANVDVAGTATATLYVPNGNPVMVAVCAPHVVVTAKIQLGVVLRV